MWVRLFLTRPALRWALSSACTVMMIAAGTTTTTRAGEPGRNPDKETRILDKDTRLRFIQRAHVWLPTDVAAKDVRRGPSSPYRSIATNVWVSCDYVHEKMSGASPKFMCKLPEGPTVKVRFGGANGEVMGSVLTSRLLWALGFGADRVYPVRVRCRGCDPDPKEQQAAGRGEQVFDPATVELAPDGKEIKSEISNGGWGWPELALVDSSKGGAPVAHRDALTLLAALVQHTDSKPEQQRLICLSGKLHKGRCARPFLFVHDVGLTFGHAVTTNAANAASVNFVAWSTTPVWKDDRACITHLPKSFTGSLEDPKIGEAGRRFLASLLARLSDRQLHDLFEVARVERRSRNPSDVQTTLPASVEEWTSAFKHKRAEIARARCEG